MCAKEIRVSGVCISLVRTELLPDTSPAVARGTISLRGSRDASLASPSWGRRADSGDGGNLGRQILAFGRSQIGNSRYA